MNKKLFLALTLLAFSPLISLAQSNVVKPVAIRWVIGETGAGNGDNKADRPRIVGTASGVKAAVAVNILNVEKAVFDMINQKRVDAGLKALAWSNELEAVARFHSGDMAEFDYFSHKSPNGKMVSDRADDAHIKNWRAIGENIAFNRGYSDPLAKAVDLWMNSPSHKNNLLKPDWKESAVGVAVDDNGAYYFTQVFMTRK